MNTPYCLAYYYFPVKVSPYSHFSIRIYLDQKRVIITLVYIRIIRQILARKVVGVYDHFLPGQF